jgi:methanethiol S-methyltransferase
MTGYILLAVRYEERDLVSHFGDRYRDYRRRVPMLIPGLGGRS